MGAPESPEGVDVLQNWQNVYRNLLDMKVDGYKPKPKRPRSNLWNAGFKTSVWR